MLYWTVEMRSVNSRVPEGDYEELVEMKEKGEADSRSDAVRKTIKRGLSWSGPLDELISESLYDHLEWMVETGRADDMADAAIQLMGWAAHNKYGSDI